MPTLVLVGPPNAGKSTIFNALTRSRAALVADFAGVTRDPLVGAMAVEDQLVTLVDTGGFTHDGDSLSSLVNQRIVTMVGEADMVLFVVEKQALPSNDVQQLVHIIRKQQKPMLLLLNKSDKAHDIDATPWYQLHPKLLEISAAHRRGFTQLYEHISQELFALASPQEQAAALSTSPKPLQDPQTDAPIELVIAGRPNVGKSTLVNHLLGENRLITSDLAGTTRDVIAFPLSQDGVDYVLLDTPGVRRWGRIHTALEKFSLLKSMEALRRCDVAVLLIDGNEGVLEQDLRLLTRFSELTPATVIGVNKIDALSPDTKAQLQHQLHRRAPALTHYPMVHISALTGKGIRPLVAQAFNTAKAARQQLPTSVLMRTLEAATAKLAPPTSGRFRPKLKFIHQVTPKRRLTIRISGNKATKLHPSYVNYLTNTLCQRFALHGVNLDLMFVDSDNPYV